MTGDWVNIKDRQPDKNGQYIVYMRDDLWGDGDKYEVTSAFYEREGEYAGWDDGEADPYITHWMPMPKPPKGEEE